MQYQKEQNLGFPFWIQIIGRLLCGIGAASVLAVFGLWHDNYHMAVVGGLTGFVVGLWQGERAIQAALGSWWNFGPK